MVYITGYSGRFPDAENVHELHEALRNKVDLISKSKRYPADYHGLPARAGHLKSIEKFDSKFFKLNKLHVEGIDPQIRLLMEVTYEAIADSGLSMAELKGSRTGVYIGHCFSDYHNGIIKNINTVNGYENVGSANSMAANKLSYFFGFHGPSFTIDTACSSSLVALDRACCDLESGIVDRAIVGGLSLNLRPTISRVFQKYNMMSPTGTCYSFDEAANGYCRSETIAALLLESPRVRSAGYVSVSGHGCNTNGNHTAGITFPSIEGQCSLIDEVVERFKIDRSSIGFIETHGTGTTAGDNVEITALDKAYGGLGAGKTIPIGAVKASLGHSEGASGMCSVIKALLMFETKQILPNIHFASTKHEPLLNGTFRVVTETEPFDTTKKVAINNFGFGGVNAHVILEDGGRRYLPAESIAKDRGLVCVYSRTEAVAKHSLALGQSTTITPSTVQDLDSFPFRGVLSTLNPTAAVARVDTGSPVSLAYVYSGQGSQYKHMAKSLYLGDKCFKATIDRLSDTLARVSAAAEDPINLHELFADGSKWDSKLFSSIGITSVQLALTNMLTEHGYAPDFVIGHSMGEIGCSYADGCLTEAQCIEISYIRTRLVALLDPDAFIYAFKEPLPTPLDAGVRLIGVHVGLHTYQATKANQAAFEAKHSGFLNKFDSNGCMLFASIDEVTAKNALTSLGCKLSVIACYNAPDGLTISGPMPEMTQFRVWLTAHEVFFRDVPTDGVAYHSPVLAVYTDYLVSKIVGAIPSPRKRTARWISTSDGGADPSCLCDAKYHTANIVGSVYFYQAIERLPPNTVVVEIGPHAGLLSQVKRCRKDLTKLLPAMSKKDPSAEVAFDKLLNSLWLNGVVSTQLFSGAAGNAVGAVSVPAPPGSASPHLTLEFRHRHQWDHDEDWKIVTYKDYENSGADNVVDVKYDLRGADAFLLDHVIQGRALFPAMGHVYTMWKTVGLAKDVQIDGLQILRAVDINEAEAVSFAVQWDQSASPGKIEVFHEGELVSSALVTVGAAFAFKPAPLAASGAEALLKDALGMGEVYSAFGRFEYNYQHQFQVIGAQSQDGSVSRIITNGGDSGPVLHWVNYLDGLLQCSISNVQSLRLPTSVKRIQLKALRTASGATVEAFPELVHVKGPVANRTIASAVATIVNLETTSAPSSASRPSTVRSVQFVPYGENLLEDPFVSAYKANFIKFCHLSLLQMITPAVLAAHPHVSNLLRYAKSVDYGGAALESIEAVAQPVFSITKDLYKDPDVWANPLLLLSTHPEHSDLYLNDVLFSSSPQALQTVVDILHENLGVSGVGYKFLEVGTGTGGALRRIYPLIRSNIELYIASDISVINVDDGLAKVKPCKWNINDPFPAKDFGKVDVVFGSNAIHCGADMKKTLGHICDALVDEGFLILEEYISELPIYLWGLDSFIWETAQDEREHGLWMEHARWERLFDEAGLDQVVSFNNGATCLYLVRKRPVKRDAGDVQIRTMDGLLQTHFDSASAETKGDDSPSSNTSDLVIVGGSGDGALGFAKSLRKEPELADRRVVAYSLPEALLAKVGAEGAAGLRALPGADKRLVTNVVTDTLQHGSYRECVDLQLLPASNWHIAIEKPGFLNTLYYKQDEPGCVDVAFVGLNFKDVMLGYGKLRLDCELTLGIEYSGTDQATGQRVMGIGSNCLAKQLPASPLVWAVPARLSMQEAATLPCVYATVLYCLDHSARIQPGQSILIHAGAGGIGQAAISVCLRRGVRVFTTCSSSKRAFLKTKYGLSDAQIGSSRDASFYDFIMEATDYQGVDVVINSLSEEMLTLSLDCVKKFGHFCEIGKYDIMADNKIGLKPFANNVSFHGVDISEMIADPHFNPLLVDLVQRGLDSGDIVPINIDCVFPHSQMEQALRYMGSGGHMGKILIRMTEDESSSSPPVAMTVRPTYRTSGTHLITGGLGGFGLELAEWLLRNGASKVLLLSRSGASKVTGYQRRKLDAFGSRMQAVQADVRDEAALEQVLRAHPDLTGVWHLAMVLQDALFKNMTKAQWDLCVDVKYTAAVILDRLTRAHCPLLRDFVLFSSISSLFGNAGQTNYAYTNARMEQLARARCAAGLPAKAVCWGRIGNVGYLANKGKVTSTDTMSDQHIDSCLADLHTMLRSTAPVMSCYKPSEAAAGARAGPASALDSILRVLGTESAKVSDSESLIDLGVDSLQVVTVRSILKSHGVERAVADVYQLTIAELRTFS